MAIHPLSGLDITMLKWVSVSFEMEVEGERVD